MSNLNDVIESGTEKIIEIDGVKYIEAKEISPEDLLAFSRGYLIEGARETKHINWSVQENNGSCLSSIAIILIGIAQLAAVLKLCGIL